MTKGSGLQSGRACLAGRIIALRCPFFQHKMSGSQKTGARLPQPGGGASALCAFSSHSRTPRRTHEKSLLKVRRASTEAQVISVCTQAKTRAGKRKAEQGRSSSSSAQNSRASGRQARVGATGSSTADSQSFRGALLCFLLYCPLRVNARRCSSQAITSARTSQGKMLEKRRFEGWRAILQRQENTWKTSRHPAAGHGSRGAYKGEQACTRKVERQCTAGRFSSLAKGAGSICDGGAR